MKKWVLAALCTTALVACKNSDSGSANVIPDAQAAETVTAATLKTDDQKASYAIGLRYGEGFARDLKEIDLDLFYKGLQDGFKGATPLMKPEEIVATLQALQSRKMKEQQEQMTQVATKNKTDGEAFLAKNKAREGVTTTASGLQYEVIQKGEGGDQPAATDKVTVNYKGSLPDGTVFDSSEAHGKPATFAVNGVIKGWTEALQLMHVGDKFKIYVPSELAYGTHGAPPRIGPNQALVFDVELLKVEKAGSTAKAD